VVSCSEGLRARLYTQPSHEPEFDKTYDVYLQIENVGIEGSGGLIKEQRTFFYSETSLNLDVTDSKNQKLARAGPANVDEITASYNICLPPGGNLAFPIGCGGAVPPREITIPAGSPAGKYLMITFELGWIIPSVSPETYYLSGTFSCGQRGGVPDKLELPPIKVTAQ